jgi:glycerol-3-phosphate dehydrogenase (NAD(P)+)
MTQPIEAIVVIGAGAWGTALAMAAQRAGRRVTLVARRAEQAAAMTRDRVNEAYLPDIELDPAIAVTADEEAAFGGDAGAPDAVLLVVPAQHLRATLERLRKSWKDAVPVLCAKGIERRTGLLMPEVCSEMLPDHPSVVLSGPNFAREVALDLPAAVTLAGSDEATVTALMNALGTKRFRPYASDDPIGAAIGGAVKNVLAIAAGIVEGRGLGENARAALITRALVEIRQLAMAKGGRPETPMGLSGLGDLLLTCTSRQSRNYSLGHALGAGETLASLLDGRRTVVEGVETAAAIRALADRLSIDMPIAVAVDAILHHGAAIDGTVGQLLGRPFRTELA